MSSGAEERVEVFVKDIRDDWRRKLQDEKEQQDRRATIIRQKDILNSKKLKEDTYSLGSGN